MQNVSPFPRSRPGARLVAVDCDNTLGSYTSAIRPYAAKYLGVDPDSLPEPTLFDYDQWGVSPAEYGAIHADAVNDGLFAHMPIRPGAAEAMTALSDAGYHLVIVTSRLLVRGQHARAITDTVTFLETNHVPFWDLCLLTEKRRLDADLWIDDSPGQITDLRARDQNVLIADQAYNRHLDGPRFAHWDEVPTLVSGMLADAAA